MKSASVLFLFRYVAELFRNWNPPAKEKSQLKIGKSTLSPLNFYGRVRNKRLVDFLTQETFPEVLF